MADWAPKKLPLTVDLEADVEVLFGELVDQLAAPVDARVVHHDVETAVGVDGLGDEAVDLVGLGDVGADVGGLAAVLLDLLHGGRAASLLEAALVGVLVDVADHDLGAFDGAGDRDAAPEAGAAPVMTMTLSWRRFAMVSSRSMGSDPDLDRAGEDGDAGLGDVVEVCGGARLSGPPSPAPARIWTRSGAARSPQGCRCWRNQSRAGTIDWSKPVGVGVEMAAGQDHELLGLARLLVGGQRELGGGEHVVLGDEHEQRCRRDAVDVAVGLVLAEQLDRAQGDLVAPRGRAQLVGLGEPR